MDLARLELMRIPLATVLFLSSVFLLSTFFKSEGGDILNTIGALFCICVLVYSIVLYSNLDVPLNRH